MKAGAINDILLSKEVLETRNEQEINKDVSLKHF